MLTWFVRCEKGYRNTLARREGERGGGQKIFAYAELTNEGNNEFRWNDGEGGRARGFL